MHEGGIVGEASESIQRAGLIPPVKGLVWQGGEGDDDSEDEAVLIDVTGPVSPELEMRLSEVLHGLAYEVRSVPPDDGVFFGGGTDYRATRRRFP